MYSITKTATFRRSVKKYAKSNPSGLKKLQIVISILASGKHLQEKYRDHELKGKFKDIRECHIESDLLLTYKIDREILLLAIIDFGSHQELFG